MSSSIADYHLGAKAPIEELGDYEVAPGSEKRNEKDPPAKTNITGKEQSKKRSFEEVSDPDEVCDLVERNSVSVLKSLQQGIPAKSSNNVKKRESRTKEPALKKSRVTLNRSDYECTVKVSLHCTS